MKEAIELGYIPTYTPNSDFYYRTYQRKSRRITEYPIVYNLYKIFRTIKDKYWKEGHRQTLSMMMAGILYRYITHDLNLIHDLMDYFIPSDDEERNKRFDPIKYLPNRKTYYGLTALEKYVNKYLDPSFKLDNYRTFKYQDILRNYGDLYDPYDFKPRKQFKKRGERKKVSEFEIKQALLITLVAKFLILKSKENKIEMLDKTSYMSGVFTLKELRESIINLLKIPSKYSCQSYLIRRILEDLKLHELIDIEYLNKSTVRILIKRDFLENLFWLITWDTQRHQFILFRLGHITSYYGYDPMQDRKSYEYKIIRKRKKSRRMQLGIHLMWTIIAIELSRANKMLWLLTLSDFISYYATYETQKYNHQTKDLLGFNLMYFVKATYSFMMQHTKTLLKQFHRKQMITLSKRLRKTLLHQLLIRNMLFVICSFMILNQKMRLIYGPRPTILITKNTFSLQSKIQEILKSFKLHHITPNYLEDTQYVFRTFGWNYYVPTTYT
jgi:hypothetical protein